MIFGRPFVKRFALCYQTVVCLSCPACPVCDVGVLWPNGWTDQDETWHAGRPWHWPHCVRWGPSSPSPKGAQSPPISGPYPLRPNRCIKMTLDMEVGLGAGDFVLDGDPAPLPKRGRSPLHNFRPISILAKRLDASTCHLARR